MFRPFRVDQPTSDVDDKAQRRMSEYFEAYRCDSDAPLPPAKRARESPPEPTDDTVRLDATQRAIVEVIVGGRRDSLLTGPAGVGKSVVLREIVRRMRGEQRRVCVTASTGRAAVELNLGATTLHSLLCLGRDETLSEMPQTKGGRLRRIKAIDQAVRALNRFVTKRQVVEQMDVLVIEEVSMISAALLDAADQVVARVRTRGMGSENGLQVLMVGDFGQLKPVTGRFAFDSRVWCRMSVESHVLQRQYRQALDARYAELLNRARTGSMTDDDHRMLEQRVTAEADIRLLGDSPVYLYPHNRQSDRHNRDCYLRLDSTAEKQCYPTIVDVERDEAAISVARDKARALREAHAWLTANRVPPVRVLRVGARVMLTANIDVPRGLANGALGVVDGFEMMGAAGRVPRIRFDNGVVCVVRRHRREFKLSHAFRGVYEEMPFIFAWAMSIHRAQGITIRGKLVTDLTGDRIFSAHQAYVSLSRIQCLDALYLTEYSRCSVYISRAVAQFYGWAPPPERPKTRGSRVK